MPRNKFKFKTFVSQRHLYRKVASECMQICTNMRLDPNINLESDAPFSQKLDKALNTNEEFEDDDTNISDNTEDLNAESDSETIDHLSEPDNIGRDCDFTDNTVSKLNIEVNNENLAAQLRYWATSCHVPHSTLTKLLHIIKPYHPELPLYSRTLLHTPLQFNEKQLDQGAYVHLGLQRGLKHFLKVHENKLNFHQNKKRKLVVSFNIDGLPLYHSTNSSFWPILGLVKNIVDVKYVFAIGIFYGTSKPTPISSFLADFIEECNNLIDDGFFVNGKKYFLHIHSFIADSPAKAFLKSIKGHNGYSCCDKCHEYGIYKNGRMILNQLTALKRTNISFRQQSDEEHHVGISPLVELNIHMIKDFPIDYMHNICLGVMKKLLKYWVGGNLNVRLPSAATNAISNKLKIFKNFAPSEINRKPRPLSELSHFKATEFRTFLLYTGIVALKDNIDLGLYNNFLLFHTAIILLITNDNSSSTNSDVAAKLLIKFIKHGEQLYGKHFVIYNVHILSHLPKDSLRYGGLDEFSAFPFENYLGQLKTMLKSSTKPLQQICRRLYEQESGLLNISSSSGKNNKYVLCDGTVPETHPYKECKKIYLDGYVLSSYSYSNSDCFCFAQNKIIKIKCLLLETCSEEITIYGQYFQDISSFYEYPFHSSHLNIFLISCLSLEEMQFSVSSIQGKFFILPYKDKFVAIPLLHSLTK